MMPLLRLNTAPVTSSHPPHSMRAAPWRLVRWPAPWSARWSARWTVHTCHKLSPMPAARNTRAAGRSQAICPPNCPLNIRSHPVGPHRPTAVTAPPTLPDSFPVTLPKPL